MRSVLHQLAGMARNVRIASIAVAVLLVAGALIGPASSMPINGSALAKAKPAADRPQRVGWVCGPYRCWWRPFVGGPFWAPYRYYRPGYYCNPYYNRYCYYGYRW